MARPVALTATLGYSILVLEWCGSSLDRLEPSELADLNPGPSCLDMLRRIHTAGVVHGDLALRNIAHGPSGFTILDWGSSTPYDEDGGARDRRELLASF